MDLEETSRMPRSIALASLLAAASLLACPSGALAQTPQFTFTVPVDLKNLPPEIDSYSVSCEIEDGSARILGGGSKNGTIAGGSFRGDVVVTINVAAPKDPSTAQAYGCVLRLWGKVGGTITQFIDNSNRASFPLAAGATYKAAATGTFPRGK